ncbi:hypothetical protein ACHAXS_006114 [Conticribra weissflogii]
MFAIDHDRQKAADMERKREPQAQKGQEEIFCAPVLLRPRKLSHFEGRSGHKSSHAETKSSSANDTKQRRRCNIHDPQEAHNSSSRRSTSKRTIVIRSEGRHIHEFNDQAETDKTISFNSNSRRPLHLDFQKSQSEHRYMPRSSPRKQIPRIHSTAKNRSLSPDETKRFLAHPLLPSLSSVASPPDSPLKRSCLNELSQVQDSPSTVTTSNESNTIIRTAKATALQCVDHASRRQAAAEVALASSSKICSSLKELWQDSEQALSLARKSRIEAENAERRAEGAAVKVKAASEVAVKDIERSKLELDEANAQAEEAWEFLRRVKGMKTGQYLVDCRHKVQEPNDKGLGEHLGTVLEIPKVIHTSGETGSGTINVDSPPKRQKGDTPGVIHVRLARTKPEDRVGGHFRKMWDDVSSMGLQSKIDAPPVKSRKGVDFKPIKKFQGHSAPVTQILVVDHNSFLSSSWDKTVRLWDINSGECLRVFQGHGDWVHSLCMGSNGHFFSGSDDRSIKMWNLKSEDCIRTFHGHNSFVKSLALLNSNYFLSGSRDRTIKLWMVGRDDCLTTFEGHGDIVSSIVPLGRNRFVSGSHDKTIKCWDASSRNCLRTIYGHTGSVKSLTRVGDSEHLVISGSDDRTIKLWDTSTGECLREFGSRAAMIFSVTFICEGFFISCGGGKIQLWHMPSGSCVQSYDTPRISLAVACVDDERFITGSDQMLHMWKF